MPIKLIFLSAVLQHLAAHAEMLQQLHAVHAVHVRLQGQAEAWVTAHTGR